MTDVTLRPTVNDMGTAFAHAAAFLGSALLAAFAGPVPGRGPGPGRTIDPRRTFDPDTRRAVMVRADHRCEGFAFFGWGRCHRDAVVVVHVYPWHKGGATVVTNGQALCQHHHDRLGDHTPPWWAVLRLERQRESYFPEFVEVRVRATLSPTDLVARGMAVTPVRKRPSILDAMAQVSRDASKRSPLALP